MTISKDKFRFNITLRKDTVKKLKKNSKERGITVSELIQCVLDAEELDNGYWLEVFEDCPLR